MKKVYETPAVEKVEFQYRDQVVVASGGSNIDKASNWDVADNGECTYTDAEYNATISTVTCYKQ